MLKFAVILIISGFLSACHATAPHHARSSLDEILQEVAQQEDALVPNAHSNEELAPNDLERLLDQSRDYERRYPDRSEPDSDIPLVVNTNVKKWIKYFTTRGRGHYARYLKRSGRYMDYMRKVLRQHDLPEDLVYLAMIESGFNARA